MNYVLTDNSLIVHHNSTITTVHSSNKNWDAIIEALRHDDYETLIKLATPIVTVKQHLEKTESQFYILGGTLFYDNEPLSNALATRIVKFAEMELPTDRLIAFYKNILKNPSYNSREQLYGFLENNELPITQDGCFLAYKRINTNWTDVHTGKINNSINAVVSMNREDVDDNPNNTCSAGLHVCSKEYLRSFVGDRLIAVKVNPKDVVSVPTDYNNSKMRVSKYVVVEELDIKEIYKHEEAWNSPAYDEIDEDDEEDYDDDDYYCDPDTGPEFTD